MREGFADVRAEMREGFADVRQEMRESLSVLGMGIAQINELLKNRTNQSDEES
jgi:hypothetical protein